MAHFSLPYRKSRKGAILLFCTMLAVLLLSACNGNAQAQQQAEANKAAFNEEIAHAQSIGIPNAMLTPILSQAAALANTNAPFTLFNDQPVTDYNVNLAQRYSMLTLEVQGLVFQATQQLDYQASQNLQTMENALNLRESQKFIEARTFATQLTNYQTQLAQAQFPKDYIHISQEAQGSTRALHLMGPAYNALVSLQQVIQQLGASHLDTTALGQQAQDDLLAFRSATGPDNFSHLIDLINAQMQETTVYSAQAIPFVVAIKIQQLSNDVNLLKQYGANYTPFQQKLTADQLALKNAKSVNDLLKVSAQIDSDTSAIQLPLVQGQANYLLKQFHTEVTSWGKTHQYHDPVDGGSYNLDYEYDQQGIGADADTAVHSAQSLDDYQSAIDLLNIDFTNLHAMEADYSDKTPWTQQHATDVSLMQHYDVYGAHAGQVIVVSLFEQALRFYNNGKLVRAFQIVTGQYLRPSPPGFWSIFDRLHPTEFKSSEPPGSAFWYPPTPIQYALAWHTDGYFIHDAYWRGIFGQGMNFPHYDPSGSNQYNDNGSHGCINMQSNDVAWLFTQIPVGTPVIVY